MSTRNLNATEMLEKIQALIDKAGPAIEHYQEVLHDPEAPRIKPEINQFYKTYDNSIVQVTGIRTTPSEMTARAVMVQGGETDDFGELLGQVVADVINDATNGDDEFGGGDSGDGDGKQFVCSVISGGHGVASLPGSVPGSTYVVDEKGLTLFLDGNNSSDADLDYNINLAYLSVVGLCLREKVKATFEATK